jgi:SAM-dependent methyltransferase
MKFTGERLVSGMPRLENMIVEELSRLNFVRSYFAGKTVLDAGCGAGYGSDFLAENGALWVLGVDISTEAIRYAAANHRRDRLAFGVIDCTRLGLKDESVDVVCSLELIEHLVQTEQFLSEVCRVLKPEGRCFMSTPNQKVSSTSSGRASWAFHKREFTLDELRELLAIYFEEVEIWGSFVPLYEHHPIRAVTKSPLSRIKHVLPSRLRLWVSSSIRFWIKPDLSFDDVVFTKSDIEEAPTFVALCSQKKGSSTDPTRPAHHLSSAVNG